MSLGTAAQAAVEEAKSIKVSVSVLFLGVVAALGYWAGTQHTPALIERVEKIESRTADIEKNLAVTSEIVRGMAEVQRGLASQVSATESRTHAINAELGVISSKLGKNPHGP